MNALAGRVASLEAQENIAGGGTISDGLNVGTESGAGTGDVRASGEAYFAGSGDHYFGGSVSIGTTMSDDPLHVSGNIRTEGLYRSLASIPGLWLDQDDGTDSVLVTLSGDNLAIWRRGSTFGSQEAVPYKFDIQAPTDSIVVDSSGRVAIGKSSPSQLFDVAGQINAQKVYIDGTSNFYHVDILNNRGDSQGWGVRIVAGESADSTPSGRFVGFQSLNGTTIGNIAGDGAGGVNYNSASDERRKDVIGDIPEEMAIALLNLFEAKRYRGKSTKQEAPVRVGFLANKVAQHTEGVATQNEDGFYSMDYSRLTPYIWRILQVHQKEIQQLKQQEK